jgi:hypothetical protein
MRIAAIAVLLALGGVLASEPAEAHGRARVSIGVGFGYPYWGWGGPWWYYPPPYYYYYPAPVVVRSEPVTYIEQSTSTAAQGGNWWYYCDASRGYYPYVKECPTGWQRVPPAPAK